jgi:serine/threonine protein kinase/outer membrane protein assembly factor BamB
VTPLLPGDPDRVAAYRLLARLGAGGMGVVYLGRSPGGRAVAVKVIPDRFANDDQFRARFRREVAAARTVTGAFTAPVLDADPAAPAPWLVTAYLPGMSLGQAIGAIGALPPAALTVLAAGMAEALADIHGAGLVHRDLKPGNVMLTAQGPRVIDFGIARPEDATAITQVGAVVGTPGFMSPEQAAGAATGPPSDIFSLGAVLAFAATGHRPFGTGAPLATLYRVLNADTDLSLVTEPWLRDLVAACLRREAGERPSAAQLLDRLGERTQRLAAGAWLPAPLAEEIDRRAAEARQWRDPAIAEPGTTTANHAAQPDAATADPAAQPSGMSAETSDLPSAGPVGPSRRTRRNVLLALGAATAGGVALARLAGRRERSASLGGPAPSAVPASGGVTPPRAVPRWRVKVSDYYPDALYTTGAAVVVRTPEDELFALDARTGTQLWRHPASLLGVVDGGLVFVAQSANPRLTLIDAATGAARWAYVVPAHDMPVRLAVGGSMVCYGYDGIRALGVGDGQPRWTAAVDAKVGLVASGAVLVAASRTALVGLDIATGRTRWTRPLEYAMYLQPADGLVLAVDRHRALHAIRVHDGSTAWAKPAFIGACRPKSDGATVYAGGGLGEVFAFRSATGERLWSLRLHHDSMLELSGAMLYAVTSDQTLHALDATDGRLLWTHDAEVVQPHRLDVGLAGDPDQAYVGLKTGYVEALAAPAGGRRAGT